MKVFHANDPTRPVTQALFRPNVSHDYDNGLADLLDVVGQNYREKEILAAHAQKPSRKILGTENTHDRNQWVALRDHAPYAGQFLWTGIDYLGEAGEWPNRANGAGLLDLCGFKKPLAWFRQSLWSDQPMVYLCATDGTRGNGRRGFYLAEHWNWPSNSTVTVICYANCPEVALTLNDQIISVKKISEATNGALRWQIPYAAGPLKAVGRSNGVELCRFALQTAGPANRIELLPDATRLRADGKDICHLEFRIVDAQGVRVPDAAPEVTLTLNGPARLLGMENGDLNSPEPYQGPTRKAFHGRGLAIFQSTTAAGKISVTATATGLEPATIELETENGN